ncbi:hypothetical protein J4H86_13515 [Spiractinospora alimapuensis]|uniref:hypothetical protein n=1 Tax=Spiractinospora alimapuensis TaxID=2820884 RepID=UPI001F1E532A|nr:hypothetical protein [Spiractinospora alimapuensis]QVQ49996.1 hypothetical protein J4H86_13515 [Spiractinospora alimapuensis]
MRPPFRLRRLTATERRVARAFLARERVDLRRGDARDDPARAGTWPRSRTVRASVLAELLATDGDAPGQGPSLQLYGARIVGLLDLRDATITGELRLAGCAVEGEIRLVDATTRSVRLNDCWIRRINATRCAVKGVFSLDSSTVSQGVRLDNAHITGVLRINNASLRAPDHVSPRARPMSVSGRPEEPLPWGLFAGGLQVEGGTFLRNSTIQGVRVPGSTLTGGLHLERSTLTGVGEQALRGDDMRAGMISLEHTTVNGTVRLRGAHIDGTLLFREARISASDRAVHLSHARVDQLIFTPASVTGRVSFASSHFGVLYSHPHSYPDVVDLTDTVYVSLRPAWPLRDHLSWVSRGPHGYRPQPYQQLAAWYRSNGQDQLARRVRHARVRQWRGTLPLPSRMWGHLLDALVGNGYRPWMAGAWSALLLAVGTVVFHLVPPTQIDPDHQRTFNPFIYTLDLLVPVSVFEQRGAWDPTGGTQWLAWVVIAAGWVLATALIAGATRTLRPGD